MAATPIRLPPCCRMACFLGGTSGGSHDQAACNLLWVSTRRQDTASQEPELRRWAESHEGDSHWYRDTYTGTSMDHPFQAPTSSRAGSPAVNDESGITVQVEPARGLVGKIIERPFAPFRAWEEGPARSAPWGHGAHCYMVHAPQ